MDMVYFIYMDVIKMTTRRNSQFVWKYWHLTSEIRAYLAGLFDGEGTLGIRVYRKKGKTPSHYLGVCVGNTHKGVIEWLVKTLGGSFHVDKSYLKRGGNIVYKWTITGNTAARFLIEVKPYLLIKSKQAELALYFQKNRRRFHVDEEELSWRELMKEKISVLNGLSVEKKKKLRDLQRLSDETSHLRKDSLWDEATV